MGLSFTVSTAPSVEPVSLVEAKAHLRVEHTDDDSYIEGLLLAARQMCEQLTRRAFITQTHQAKLDSFPGIDGVIRLPRAPVQSITSIVYVDENGTSTTLSASEYASDLVSYVPRIYPAYDEVWPTTRDIRNAVTITYVAGYGATGASVPEPIRHAIKLLVGTYYDAVREAVIVGDAPVKVPMAVDYLLAPYKISEVAG